MKAATFTPCVDGRYLLLTYNQKQNYKEISRFSKRDADAFPRDFVDLLLSPTSKVEMLDDWNSIGNEISLAASCLAWNWDSGISISIPGSNSTTDVLKATLAGDAIIGSMASIHAPGSGYVLLHHVMGNTDGERNVWSHVEGGMGSVSSAISKAAREVGAHIVTNAEVSQLMIEDSGVVNGVLLEDGTQVYSSVVLSNATPYKTFMELVPQNVLPDDFFHAIKNIDYKSNQELGLYPLQGTTKINVAVDKLPEFQCYKFNHPEAGPHHTATIHIGTDRNLGVKPFPSFQLLGPVLFHETLFDIQDDGTTTPAYISSVDILSMEEIGLACQDAWNGLSSRRPVIEMTIPSSLDKTISPPGKHVVSLFTQYTPYNLTDGSWEDPAYRESYAKRCFNLIDEYAPGFSSSVIGYDMLAPPDLERVIGLTGGNIFHGAMSLDSLFLMRPVKGWSGYRTPVRGLYLCGSGTHPGGGVMGAPGRNSAQVVIQDLKKYYV
ncbi:Pyridine nucleotide-disulfide oxidoreductase domain-containing protein 2 [Vitis vinifera]|uniref:Pyridine nucleotide-disulfide oxidoreductase domain-containing protein 2 n=1 Tax=Vitis vinifera TaxID=29760 RepID=A0A438K6K7_VITVI|nr:Pyridine nucleotide-disulfide oxidoreductase domain-containing protein 2 [Vitis vinifera]